MGTACVRREARVLSLGLTLRTLRGAISDVDSGDEIAYMKCHNKPTIGCTVRDAAGEFGAATELRFLRDKQGITLETVLFRDATYRDENSSASMSANSWSGLQASVATTTRSHYKLANYDRASQDSPVVVVSRLMADQTLPTGRQLRCNHVNDRMCSSHLQCKYRQAGFKTENPPRLAYRTGWLRCWREYCCASVSGALYLSGNCFWSYDNSRYVYAKRLYQPSSDYGIIVLCDTVPRPRPPISAALGRDAPVLRANWL